MVKLLFYFMLAATNGSPGQVVPIEMGPYSSMALCQSKSVTEREAAAAQVIEEHGEYGRFSGWTCSVISNSNE
tara:strand:+ start:22854 stop:23072 length:219 start_codon:yes stop_codon:yes gene_type:complete